MDLAFDLAGKAGWAAGETGGPYRTGSMALSWGTVGHNVGTLYMRAFSSINDLLALHTPARVTYEKAIPPGMNRRSSADTIIQLMGLITVLELACARRGIPTYAAFRASACAGVLGDGHGHASKEAVMAFCAMTGINVANDDEADAAIQLLFLHKHRG